MGVVLLVTGALLFLVWLVGLAFALRGDRPLMHKHWDWTDYYGLITVGVTFVLILLGIWMFGVWIIWKALQSVGLL